MHRIILWLRNDLRMHDNQVLRFAVGKHQNTQVLPVFCFDPRSYDDTVSKFGGTRKAGVHKTRFDIESVLCLRKNLQSIGSGLLVTREKPEVFFPKLLQANAKHTIVY